MTVQPTTPLEARLKRFIALHGPIPLALFMAQCLGDPEHGYYTTRDPLGAAGDFITAPEVSQMFGELLGIWMLSLWQQQGCPSPFQLVELGPGRGTLMRDMIRAISSNEAAGKALAIHLVDISPTLKAQQAETLRTGMMGTGTMGASWPITWHDDIGTLPQAPLFIIANEFFDSLPIHQWVFHEKAWHERVVGLDKDGNLAFGLGPLRDLDQAPTQQSPENGAIVEHCPMAEAIIADLATHIGKHGGAGLIIDYGYDKPGYGDTLQALSRHAYAIPLAHPGEQDLTAHVNFARLADCATRATHDALTIGGPLTQGDFLLAMGLLERAGQLGRGKPAEIQEAIQAAVERLAAPNQMGALFKILALYPKGIAAPVFTHARQDQISV